MAGLLDGHEIPCLRGEFCFVSSLLKIVIAGFLGLANDVSPVALHGTTADGEILDFNFHAGGLGYGREQGGHDFGKTVADGENFHDA